ncbi:MAG TPA: DUF4113 domain-containing protein, partial [Candidatus Babeliaceae bacterium]|nr:DUF4113 domain-containing protein [Candidatus Babeliaceae bacterium]
YITNHPEIDTFLASIEVGDIWGIGSRYAKLLRSNRITNACEFKYLDEKWVRKNMTIVGHKTLLELRGIPCIGLQDCPEPKKSITVSRMFGKKTTNITYVKEGLAHYVAGAAQKLRAQSSLTSLVTVFIVAAPLYEPRNIYDAVTLELSMGTNYTPELIEVAHRCLAKLLRPGFIYKKVGVTLHNFVSDNHMQLNTLYSIKENFTKDREKRLKFMDVLDKVTTKWGKNIIFFGAEGIEQEWRMNQAKKSANFTTNWHELLTINLT